MLLKNNDTILRVLQSHDDKALVIDCVKRTMPKWVEKTFLSDYVDCCDAEMYECTDYPAGRTLTQEEQRIAQEHYTMIAGVQVLQFLDTLNISKGTFGLFVCCIVRIKNLSSDCASARCK